MNKRNGIVLTLVGVGLFLISILFATGGNPNSGLFDNIASKKIVIMEPSSVPNENIAFGRIQTYREEGGLAIPLKLALSLSIIMILSGIGMVIIYGKDHVTKNGS